MSNEKRLLVFEQEYQLVKSVAVPNQLEPSVKEVEYDKWKAQYYSFEDADADLKQLIKTRQDHWLKKGIIARIFRASTTPL
jgi:hypothetical protein